MDPGINRAEQLYLAWEQRQKELERNMGASLDAQKMQTLKYQFLSLGLFRVSVGASEKERLYIQVIRAVVSRLAKMLYPNPVLRFLIGIKQLVFDGPMHLRRFNKLQEENKYSLIDKLGAIGLGGMATELGKVLDYERQSVSYSVLRGLSSGEKLKVTVSLEKEGLGNYQMKGFRCGLLYGDEPERSCFFAVETGLNLSDAINLLRGGSVLKNYQDLDGKVERSWVTLSNSGMDGAELSPLISTGLVSAFDLKKQLLDHAIALECYAISSDLVLRGLEQGNRMEISIPGKNKFYIRAGPFENRLEFFDSAKKEIGFDKLKEMLVPVKAETPLAPGLIQPLDQEKQPQLELNR